jgi:ribokinase
MAGYADILAIVPGGSNTDLILSGARTVAPGELSSGGRFAIGPGGKSRNVAQMMAAYLGPGRVAFLGRTLAPPPRHGLDAAAPCNTQSRRADEHAKTPRRTDALAAPDDLVSVVHAMLAQVPLEALRRAGVVTDFVQQVPYTGTPAGIAQILVSPDGQNTIYLAPGLNAEFAPADIDAAEPLFAAARRGRGAVVLPLALEIPPATAAHAARKARDAGMTVVLDPGGLARAEDAAEVLPLVDIIKPNEHEARLLTGIDVTDDASAARAAEVLRSRYGIPCTIITAGARGAWLVRSEPRTTLDAATETIATAATPHVTFYPACRVPRVTDTTGCGDQFMAVLCARLALDRRAADAAMRDAVLAAALQATRAGIDPVTADDVRAFAAGRYSPGT